MLTGKDVYDAVLEAIANDEEQRHAYAWDRLNTYEKTAFGIAATALNGTFLAPLQGRVAELEQENQRLRAKVEELEQENTDLEREILETDDDEPLMPSSAGVAMAAAMTEQAKRIDALEALVKEMEQTLVYCWDNEFPVDEVEALQRRVKELLKGA